MARAALDFAVKYATYYNFPSDFNALSINERQAQVIEMFEERQATEGVFSIWFLKANMAVKSSP